MKIIHVETGMHLYGGALQVLFLLQGLRRHPGEHILVCPPRSAISGAARQFARVVEIPCRGDHDLSFLWKLKRLLQQEQPDLVHLHSRRGADLLGGIAAKIAGIPAILSRRVDNPEPRWLVAQKYRLYAHIIAISEAIERLLLKQGVPPEKVSCVRSAVDTNHYQPHQPEHAWFKQEFGLAAEDKTVGMAAQFIRRKGHHTLIQAIPAILQKQPQTRFILFGQGPEESTIRDLIAQKNLQEHVVFAGFRTDLDRILPCLDLLVHPACREGLGVILLQATACGLPIIASRAGGIPEIVRHLQNGELFTPGDSEQLSYLVAKLLSDKELRRRYGEAGTDLATHEFSIDAMVAGNLQVYESLQ